MKTKMNSIAKMAKVIAERSLKRDANCTTSLYFYQPRVPANLKRFKSCKK